MCAGIGYLGGGGASWNAHCQWHQEQHTATELAIQGRREVITFHGKHCEHTRQHAPPHLSPLVTSVQARHAYGGDLDIYTSSFKPMRNTISGNEGRAFMKIIVHRPSDRVLGIHMVGGWGWGGAYRAFDV